MVDNRYLRENKPGDPACSLLGADQMKWLEEQLLACQGPFVLLSCGTMWTDHVSKGKDSWGKFAPEDRERIFSLIEKNRIGGVLLISGDRHGACGYRIPRPSGFNLYEFNVGCLGGISGDAAPAGNAPEANGALLYRYGQGYAFGEFEFNTATSDPTVTFRLIQDDGRVLYELTLSRNQLKTL
jgi:alkaline phosphatase D